MYNDIEKYNLIEGMFKDDKLRELCLEGVDIIIADEERQRAVKKEENALINTDPCTDTKVTLIYRFKGSRNITLDLMIQSKSGCASISEGQGNMITVAVLASSVTLVITLVLVLVGWLCRRSHFLFI